MDDGKSTLPDTGLGEYDRDVFLRVWSRVMPEGGDACPIMTVPPEEKPCRTGEVEGNDFPPPEDVPCLGMSAQEETERLRQFVTDEMHNWQRYRALSRRSGQCARQLSALAGGCRRRAKRLSAALFLITGVRFWPPEQSVPVPRSYFGALRELFLAEQNRGGAYRSAAEESRDGCLQRLYLDLSDECTVHAAHIRAMIENS